jgi:O-antigen/teichoic acid export membrane protein
MAAKLARKQVLRNIVYSYGNLGLAFVAVVVLVPLYTRFLGERVYGEWLVIASIMNYLALAGLGMDQVVANRIAELRTHGKSGEVGKLVSTAFFAYGVVALALVAGFAGLSGPLGVLFLHDHAAVLALAVAGTFCALAIPLNANAMMLRGFNRVDQDQSLALSATLARTVGFAGALLLGFKLLALAVVQGGAALARGLGALVRSLKLSDAAIPRLREFSFPLLRTVVAPSLGFLILQVAGIIGFGIDNLVIGYALGPEAVTRYAVPFSLLLASAALVSTAITALHPTITGFYAEGRKSDLAKGLTVGLRLAMLYGGVGGILFWIAGPWLLRFWAGPGIFPGSTVFALQIGLFILQVVIEPPFELLVATTRHYGTAWMHVVESVLNLSLSLLWVRTLGLTGVIAGTLVARLATTAWYIPLAALRTLDLSPFKVVREVWPGAVLALVALASSVILWPGGLGASVLAAFPAAVLASALFLLAFGWIGFSREERQGLAVQLARLLREGVSG